MFVHPFACAFSLLTLAIAPGTRPRPISPWKMAFRDDL